MADVSTKSQAVLDMEEDLDLACALLGGTRAMRKAGEKYLPKWPAEDDEAYKCRLKTATLFPAYGRTVETLTGKPFSKPLTLSEDMPEKMRAWCDNIDLQGRNLHSFGADQLESALGKTLGGILVDYPRVSDVRTKAEEKATGARPYMVEIHPGQIRGWKTEMRAGQTVLTQFRFMECVTEEDGEYGEKEIEQIRVLGIGTWEIHRKNDKNEWVLFDQGRTSIDFVPFVPTYGDRQAFMVSKPPLIEVAYLNVEHWQSASDQQNILHMARVPILAVIGVEDDKFQLKVGASTAVKLPLNGDMKFVEHTGAAIEAGRVALEDLEERMRQAGAELLVIKPGKITATQVASEDSVGMCALNRIVNDLQDSINQALDMMAKWVNEPKAGTCRIYNDFGAATLAEASAELLFKMNTAGKLSDETLFLETQRRGMIAADKTWEDERERIQSQGPALASA